MMPGLQFDYKGARAAGYSDTEIADMLGQKAGFDSAAARAAGHPDLDIINRLTGSAVTQPTVDQARQKAMQQTAEEQGVGQTLLIGAGRTFDRIGKGMQQLYYGATGNDAEQAKLKARAEHDDETYNALTDAHPVATAVGEALPAMIVPVGGAGGLAATTGKLALAGAVPEALKYGDVGDRAGRAAAGAAGSVIGGVVIPKAAGAVVNSGKAALRGLAGKISPEALALAEKAKAMGIPVNAAQLSDSKFLKTLASATEQLPFTGATKKAVEQRAAYNKAVAETFGENVDSITPEVYSAAKQRIGDTFNELSSRNNLSITPELRTKLSQIAESADRTASDDTIRAVRNVIGRVTDQANTSGGRVPAQLSSLVDEAGNPIVRAAAQETPVVSGLPGTAYSSIDTELGNIIKAGGEKGRYAKEMQVALRNAMDESIAPADQAAWRQARDQYRNLKAVRNSVSRDGDVSGNISPTQLTQSLMGTEAGREALAMGTRGQLGDLASVGRRFVRDNVPNSGTAQRLIAMSALGAGSGAMGADPGTIAGVMLGGATSGRLVTKLLNNPKVINALAQEGMSVMDLAKLPPARVAQIIGGIMGDATAIENTRD